MNDGGQALAGDVFLRDPAILPRLARAIDLDEVRMPQLSDDLDGSDFLRGRELVSAGEELQRDNGAARSLGFPDAAETASATEAAEPVARPDFLVDAQRGGLDQRQPPVV